MRFKVDVARPRNLPALMNCTGSGMVKSIPTICYEIQTEAKKMAARLTDDELAACGISRSELETFPL